MSFSFNSLFKVLRSSSSYAIHVLALSSRYDVQNLPSTVIGLEKWIQQIWSEKEEFLETFKKTSTFQNCCAQQHSIFRGVSSRLINENRFARILPFQYTCLAFWLWFIQWAIFNILFTFYGLLWVVFVSLIMACVSRWTSGLQEFEIALEKRGLFSALYGGFHNSMKKRNKVA